MLIHSKIDTLIDGYLPELTALRHLIHKNPEPAYNEVATSKLIKETLSKLQLEIKPPLIGTDVVAILNSTNSKNITFRSDIDALLITEKTKLNYKSNNCYMHACGHDGHIAIMLGTAMVLNALKENLNCSVRFIFQPAEENLCGGRKLVESGVLRNPTAEAVFALHGAPGQPENILLTAPGTMTTGCKPFKIIIYGKSGHSTIPEKCIDPILTSAKIILNLKMIPSVNFSPKDIVLVSVCNISGGTTDNIIPDTTELNGNFRYYTPTHSDKIEKLIIKTIRSACSESGADFNCTFGEHYIPSVNDDKMVDFWSQSLKKYLPENTIITNDQPSSTSEDFSYYLNEVPGVLFRLGLGVNHPNLHSSEFDFNDNTIKTGIKAFVALALEYK